MTNTSKEIHARLVASSVKNASQDLINVKSAKLITRCRLTAHALVRLESSSILSHLTVLIVAKHALPVRTSTHAAPVQLDSVLAILFAFNAAKISILKVISARIAVKL